MKHLTIIKITCISVFSNGCLIFTPQLKEITFCPFGLHWVCLFRGFLASFRGACLLGMNSQGWLLK